MTDRIDNTVFIELELEQQCDDCGLIAELRPYGPGGSCICHDCGKKDQDATNKRMEQALFG